jgi:putative oxidoreductase
MTKGVAFFQLYLRIALSAGYLSAALDRLGFWGKYGDKHVSWGDWQHFMLYAADVMSFLPYRAASVLAVFATIGEISIGLLLQAGKWTRWAAKGSGLLSGLFGLSMAISHGVQDPLGYSVFVVSASSFLLSALPSFKWSLDDGVFSRPRLEKGRSF